MPRKAPADASTSSAKEGEPTPKRGAKRQSTDHDSAPKVANGKRARVSDITSKEQEVSKEEQRPRLTTPDLEFDYDRSQLRDPRQTPGRVRRPRPRGSEVTEEFKQQFFIPQAERPKGRLNAYQKDQLHREQSLLDPTDVFHDLYVCHKKGPHGTPVYDSAGFQLDYRKVDEWMKPKPYNKSRIVRGMERSIERGEHEKRATYEIFFVQGDEPGSTSVMDYVKDHIAKDLNVPWHQIDSGRAREWQQKGFEKKKFSEWWREPNDEERKRMSKMIGGASLRKDH
ncbi:hypothetical protein F5B22DRAFT_381767 [Xylaria bambusicola]|uniref:uncharacterized protein n=1 Tax=Xylaria bambusicola TaxID=326684 RepID=UPI0020078810|nr:uncharacterized protein F5B22DRAFT_381767 [Xylaria bambusicola]KAI0508732.1 hypothetical protein F5B22DRAFT_381767 [Xylaria bambusicola]